MRRTFVCVYVCDTVKQLHSERKSHSPWIITSRGRLIYTQVHTGLCMYVYMHIHLVMRLTNQPVRYVFSIKWLVFIQTYRILCCCCYYYWENYYRSVDFMLQHIERTSVGAGCFKYWYQLLSKSFVIRTNKCLAIKLCQVKKKCNIQHKRQILMQKKINAGK